MQLKVIRLHRNDYAANYDRNEIIMRKHINEIADFFALSTVVTNVIAK